MSPRTSDPGREPPSPAGVASPPAEIPHRLEDLLGFSTTCSCGREHRVTLRGASIRRGALEDVVDWARDVGRKLSICLVVDRVTRELAGERVKRLLEGDGQRTGWVVVPDGAGGRPHADQSSMDLVQTALQGADLAVAVGSGTLCDLAKLASFRRKIPCLVVATAPSMNGYTSAIAAVMLRGVKRTVECHQPRAVLADLELIERAPPELIAAGLGDLESKPTATADFRLGGLVRGDYYCPAPEKVVMQAEARVAESAEGLGRRDPQALTLLTEALLLSGLSMKLAGVSSPASGGEHLISHYWDMTAAEENRVEGWHGAQVGVATIVTATLFGWLREIPAEEIDVDALVDLHPTRRRMEEQIRGRHGPRSEEVAKEFFGKYPTKRELRRQLYQIREDWKALWESLSEVLRTAASVRSVLVAAGAPTTVAGLGLTPDHLRRAFPAAREIRGRYTVLDLAADLGLDDSRAESILRASGCLGG